MSDVENGSLMNSADDLSEAGNIVGDTASNLTKPVRKAGKKAGKEVAKKSAKVAGKAAKEGAKATGKVAKEGAKVAGKASVKAAQGVAAGVKALIAATGGFIIPAIAILIILVILINVLAGALAAANLQEKYTPECQKTWEYLKLTVNDSMQQHSGLSDSKKSYYRGLLSSVEKNQYKAEATAIFKTILFEYVSSYLEYTALDATGKWNSAEQSCKEYVYSKFTRYFRAPTSSDGTREIDGTYYLDDCDASYFDSQGYIKWDDFWAEWSSNTNSSTSGDEEWHSDIEWMTHIYFVQYAAMATLDAFVDDETGKVFKAATDEDRTEKELDIYNTFCINVKDSSYYTVTFNTSLSGNNTPRLVYLTDTIGHIKTVTDDEGNITERVFELDSLTGSSSDEFYRRFHSIASSFKLNLFGGCADIINLALEQVGNTGQTYCQEMYGGMADWCAIFCGWLLRTCGYDENDFGYSPGVGIWASNAQSNGSWHTRTSGYQPKEGDFIIFGYDGGSYSHIGIVVEVGGNSVTTVEGNTRSNDFNTSVVSQNNYAMSYGSITGYVENNFPSSSSADGSSTSLHGVGNVTPDPSYRCVRYNLNSEQRAFLEHVVTGEFGNDYVGSCLIAQCLRDAFVYGLCNDPMKVKQTNSSGGLGYTGWSDTVTDNARRAIKYIFDEGNAAVPHRILYMCTEDFYSTGNNAWHYQASHGNNPTIKFILQHQNVVFFDRNY